MGRDQGGVAAGVLAALEALPNPAAVVDARGVARLWNTRASAALGWPALDGKAHHDLPVFARPDATWFARLRRDATEAGNAVGVTLRKRGLKERWVRCTMAPSLLPELGGQVYLVTLRDVTATRLRDREHGVDRAGLADASAQLRQAQKMEAIGRLAGGIAHDFNNLITAIRGHAQFLVEDLPEEDPSRSDAMEIRHAADRAAQLTRQLLTFGRRQDVAPQELLLNDVITSMEGLLRRLIREDIGLRTELANDVWTVRMDPSHVEQVLMNLVVNARDALPEGGTITVRTGNVREDGVTSAGEQPLGACAMLEVQDDGIGMDSDTMARIFEPFFTTKGEGEGTGLGLSTVYGIVRQAGGRVAVESRPDQGTRIRVLMPRNHED